MPEPAVASIPLHARVDGDGVPILMLHGLGGDHAVWNAQVAPLAKDFHVIAPDLRGHGRSPFPEGSTLSFAEHEADLEALLARERLTSVHLVGLSAGGMLALQWAFDCPDRVRSLTLIGASSHCDAHTRAVGERWAEVLRTEGFDAYVLRLLKDLFSPDWIEAHMAFADQLKDNLRQRDLKGTILWGQSIRKFDLRGRLGRLQLPTLVLQGMDDQVVDPSHGRLLRQAIRGAELRLFPNTGHMVPIEQPDATLEAIAEGVRTSEVRRTPASDP